MMSNWIQASVSCGLLFLTFLFLQLRSYGEAVPIHKPLAELPQTIGGWQGRADATLEPDILAILKLNDYVMRDYIDMTGHNIWLYVGFWETQRKGAQIHSPKHCLPGGGWEPLEASLVRISFEGEPQGIVVNRYVLQKETNRQVVTYWYQSQGQVMAKEIDAKLQLIKHAIVHNRTDGALIRLTSPVTTTVEEAFTRQVEYIRALRPLLREFLPQ
jgi:EpsI family protein